MDLTVGGPCVSFPSCQVVSGLEQWTVELSVPSSSAVAAVILPTAFCVEVVFLALFLGLLLALLVPWRKILQGL